MNLYEILHTLLLQLCHSLNRKSKSYAAVSITKYQPNYVVIIIMQCFNVLKTYTPFEKNKQNKKEWSNKSNKDATFRQYT